MDNKNLFKQYVQIIIAWKSFDPFSCSRSVFFFWGQSWDWGEFCCISVRPAPCPKFTSIVIGLVYPIWLENQEDFLSWNIRQFRWRGRKKKKTGCESYKNWIAKGFSGELSFFLSTSLKVVRMFNAPHTHPNPLVLLFSGGRKPLVCWNNCVWSTRFVDPLPSRKNFFQLLPMVSHPWFFFSSPQFWLSYGLRILLWLFWTT